MKLRVSVTSDSASLPTDRQPNEIIIQSKASLPPATNISEPPKEANIANEVFEQKESFKEEPAGGTKYPTQEAVESISTVRHSSEEAVDFQSSNKAQEIVMSTETGHDNQPRKETRNFSKGERNLYKDGKHISHKELGETSERKDAPLTRERTAREHRKESKKQLRPAEIPITSGVVVISEQSGIEHEDDKDGEFIEIQSKKKKALQKESQRKLSPPKSRQPPASGQTTDRRGDSFLRRTSDTYPRRTTHRRESLPSEFQGKDIPKSAIQPAADKQVSVSTSGVHVWGAPSAPVVSFTRIQAEQQQGQGESTALAFSPRQFLQ